MCGLIVCQRSTQKWECGRVNSWSHAVENYSSFGCEGQAAGRRKEIEGSYAAAALTIIVAQGESRALSHIYDSLFG